MLRFLTTLLVVCFLATSVYSQSIDYDTHSAWILPATLIGLGIAANNTSFKEEVQKSIPRTDTDIDDYLQFAPIALMYSSYLWDSEHRNNIGVQSAYWGVSQGISHAAVWLTKWLVDSERPNGTNNRSMPSAHTANAFVNATVLYEEFKNHNLWMAYSGYLMATAVGLLRITNNAHWISDVLVGAGIGILATKLVYLWDFRRSKKSDGDARENKAVEMPIALSYSQGGYLVSYTFNLN